MKYLVPLFLVTVLIAGFLIRRPQPSAPPIVDDEPLSDIDWSKVASTPTQPHRLIYPYSLIPGGVLTLDEFEAKVKSDSLLSKYYQQFDFSHAAINTFDTDEYLYVAFLNRG